MLMCHCTYVYVCIECVYCTFILSNLIKTVILLEMSKPNTALSIVIKTYRTLLYRDLLTIKLRHIIHS